MTWDFLPPSGRKPDLQEAEPFSRWDVVAVLFGAAVGASVSMVIGTRPAPVVVAAAAALTGVGVLLVRRSLLLELAALVMVGGLLQGVASTISPVRASLLLDDLPFLLLVLALVPAVLRDSVRLQVALGVTAILVTIAVLRSPDVSVGVLQSRQVMIPPLLLLAGYLLAPRDWRFFKIATLAVAAYVCVYCAVERLGWAPLDPTLSLAANDRADIYVFKGLPGYYYYYGLSAEPLIRTGGPFLNPTSTGLFLGTAAVVAFATLRGPWRWVCTAIVLLATMSTFSRAGVLVAMIGLAGPWLLRRVRMRFALAAAAVAAAVAGFVLAGQAGSAAHVGGLVDGLKQAFLHPLGRGFGHNGNIAVDAGLATEGESLLAVALVAIGLSALAAVGWVAVRVLTRLYSPRTSLVWHVTLGAAALVIAATAETASSLDACLPLWLLAGRGMALPPAPRHADGAGGPVPLDIRAHDQVARRPRTDA